MPQAVSRAFANFFWKLWYPALTRLTRNSSVIFLNYGYAPEPPAPPLALTTQDEPNRACIQLYDRVVGPVDLRGLDVLEISCGHGGGAAHLARTRGPRSVHGVDRNLAAIDFCKANHTLPNVEFSRGDATALDFAEGRFHAVINVEASHCYPDVPRFFCEVSRVLRPGGSFLFADFRAAHSDSDILHRQIERSGMEVIARDDISAGVLRGMRLNHDHYMDLIRCLVPRPLRKPAMRFAGVKGSMIYRELESGQTVYWAYVLRKQAEYDRRGY